MCVLSLFRAPTLHSIITHNYITKFNMISEPMILTSHKFLLSVLFHHTKLNIQVWAIKKKKKKKELCGVSQGAAMSALATQHVMSSDIIQCKVLTQDYVCLSCSTMLVKRQLCYQCHVRDTRSCHINQTTYIGSTSTALSTSCHAICHTCFQQCQSHDTSLCCLNFRLLVIAIIIM